jgi:hypothetical protein
MVPFLCGEFCQNAMADARGPVSLSKTTSGGYRMEATVASWVFLIVFCFCDCFSRGRA